MTENYFPSSWANAQQIDMLFCQLPFMVLTANSLEVLPVGAGSLTVTVSPCLDLYYYTTVMLWIKQV